jgi:hypothetical protein
VALPKIETFTTDSPDKALDTYDANWVIYQGTITVYFADDDCAVNDNFSQAIWNGDVFNDDQYAEATFDTQNGNHMGICVRGTIGSGSGDGYYFVGGATSYFGTIDEGVWTDIGGDRGSFNIGGGDVIRLEFVGDGWTLKKNGGELASGTDATYSSGKAGLAGNHSSMTHSITSWEGGNMDAEWTSHVHKKLIFG